MGMHWTGIVFGLGAVQAMGYWTTDFLVVQRVLSAKDIRSAKMAPIIGSFFKMAVPLIVILPGLLGLAVLRCTWFPRAACSLDNTVTTRCSLSCSPATVGPACWARITALVAGFMAGMAGNVSAFATVWTYDIYRPFLRKTAPDQHYVSMGRWCTLIGLVVKHRNRLSRDGFASIMDYVQALFGFFIAPLFGTVLLGMLWKRVSRAAGFLGLLAGNAFFRDNVYLDEIGSSLGGRIRVVSARSGTAQDMYQALWSCVTCVVVTVLVTLVTNPRPDEELKGLVYALTEVAHESTRVFYTGRSFGE